MASLNVPFLMFSRTNFVFESKNTCYTWIITETDIEEIVTYVPENTRSFVSTCKGFGRSKHNY